MEEINRSYGAESENQRRARKEQERAAAKAKKRKEEELKGAAEEPAFESGFDHGFDRMATFNGRAVGKEGGPEQTASLPDSTTPQQQATPTPAQ